MRSIEVNPGEIFAVSDKVILMEEYEAVFRMAGMVGAKHDRLTYALTLSGRLNKQTKKADVTVLISPEDMVNMVTMMVGQVEWLEAVLDSAAKQAKRGGR